MEQMKITKRYSNTLESKIENIDTVMARNRYFSGLTLKLYILYILTFTNTTVTEHI